MLKRIPARWAVAALPLLAGSPAAPTAEVDVDRIVAMLRPLQVRSESVGSGLRVNGVPLQVRHLVVDARPAEVATVIAAARPDIVRAVARDAGDASSGAWITLGRLDHATHEAWQLRAAGPAGTEVILSVADLAQRPLSPPAPPLGLPPGARLISTVESSDRGRRVVQHLVRSRLSPPQLLGWVRDAAAARGWESATADESRGEAAGFLVAHRRGRVQLTTVVAPARAGTSIVFNQVGQEGP